MKTVYLLDAATAELCGEYQAQESPLEPGKYITPENSTDIKPLTPKVGFAICFINGGWQYKADQRGIWYTPIGEALEVTALDAAIDKSLKRDKPPATPEQLQAQTNADARAYLDSTDWLVTRFAETGVVIPADIAAARQAARESIV